MVKEYIKNNESRFINELIELLKIPSISADSKFKNDIQKAAEYVKQKLIEAGAENAELCPTGGNPIVYAEKMIDTSWPTVLVYGHYDVQPPDPLELWESPPFEPIIKDGKIYARGASDDKGQFYMHIKALEILTQENLLKCNVKFLIEGEEEIGSDNLDVFVKNNKDKLSADVVLISDTVIYSNEHPSITVGLRGLCYVEVEVTGPKRDLHSGMYGGAVKNPINALCEMISKLKNQEQKVTIPGFYDDVEELSIQERSLLNQVPFDLQKYQKDLLIDQVSGEIGFNTLERVSIRPTLDVNGIWGGYTGEGAKTVLPSKAFAKISMRLVPHQSSNKVAKLFEAYFLSLAPEGIKAKVKFHHGGEPAVTPIDSRAFKAAEMAFLDAWGKKPIPMREGGSIPIVSLFERELGINTLLMGFGLHEDSIHSPNESFTLFNYMKGIETIVLFYKYFPQTTDAN